MNREQLQALSEAQRDQEMAHWREFMKAEPKAFVGILTLCAQDDGEWLVATTPQIREAVVHLATIGASFVLDSARAAGEPA